MSLIYILLGYIILAGILVITSLVVISFTWRFRYLGPATSIFVALFITATLLNMLITTWYILRTDWTDAIFFTLGSGLL